ncbi:hypothetical protein PNOK_0344900 [Pyrrhoderma noxium]|uniref:Uncharacterized protein n=1 Tax=Pyrrhoderma noxium TaxID=2282107 RepID=A0A286UMM6_9AGAM|nr:hypothetical protein PNOK_0344900 [Pyrrhoderma noxium]
MQKVPTIAEYIIRGHSRCKAQLNSQLARYESHTRLPQASLPFSPTRPTGQVFSKFGLFSTNSQITEPFKRNDKTQKKKLAKNSNPTHKKIK